MSGGAIGSLERDQRSLLSLVHRCLREEAVWPTFAALDRQVDQQLNLDAAEVLGGLPAGLVLFDDHLRATGEVALLARGLLALDTPEAVEDAAVFWGLVQLALSQERGYEPEGTDPSGEARIDVDMARARLRMDDELVTEDAARRAFLILRSEGLYTSAGGPEQDGRWYFTVDRKIRRWRGATLVTYAEERAGELSMLSAAPGRAAGSEVFVSFAHRDRVLALAFTDFLRAGCNLSEEQIFLTARPSELEPGTYFVQLVRAALDRAAISVLLLSPSYYESRFCLAELGAVWGAQGQCVPLLVSPSSTEDLEGVQLGQQALRLHEASDLDVLRDRVAEVMGQPASTPEWNRHRDNFLNDWDTELADSIATPRTVPAEAYSELEERLVALREQFEASEQESERRREFAARLKADNERLRGGGTVNDPPPERHTGDEAGEQVADALQAIEAAQQALSGFPDIVRDALYRHFNDKRPLTVGGFEDQFDGAEAQHQVDEGYLDWDPEGNGVLWPRFDHPEVEVARSALGRVRSYAFDGDPGFLKAKAGPTMRPVLKERFGIEDPQFELAPTWRALKFL